MELVPLYWFDAVSFLAVVIAAQQLRSVRQTATNTAVDFRDALFLYSLCFLQTITSVEHVT
jgi:hypothetical protein